MNALPRRWALLLLQALLCAAVPRIQRPDGRVVLLTGGAGFIGSHVAETLLARGDQVAIVDEVNNYYDVRLKRANIERLEASFGRDLLRVYYGDICDQGFIKGVFETERPQWIVHLAARAGVRPSIQDPLIYVHSNVQATTLLLELARQYNNKHFVFASSSSVYGGLDKKLFSETDTVDSPISPYAATKKSCELIGACGCCLSPADRGAGYTYHHLYKLNVAGLRFFTVYGPRGRPDMAPFIFVDRVSRGLEIMQYGDGSTSRDYTYIDDIVDGVVRTLDRPAGYQVYNLGNGNPVVLRHFINLVEKATGRKALIKQMPMQPGDVPRTAADISKAQRMLGYEPKVSFEAGIGKLVAWHQNEYTALMSKLGSPEGHRYSREGLIIGGLLLSGVAIYSLTVAMRRPKART